MLDLYWFSSKSTCELSSNQNDSVSDSASISLNDYGEDVEEIKTIVEADKPQHASTARVARDLQ